MSLALEGPFQATIPHTTLTDLGGSMAKIHNSKN